METNLQFRFGGEIIRVALRMQTHESTISVHVNGMRNQVRTCPQLGCAEIEYFGCIVNPGLKNIKFNISACTVEAPEEHKMPNLKILFNNDLEYRSLKK